MSEESRYGATVRERTKILAALLRTPDEDFEVFIQANDLPPGIDANRLRLVRDLMDALGEGLQGSSADAFWPKLDAAWSALCASGRAPVVASPVAAPPAAPAPVAAPTPAAGTSPPISATAPFPKRDFRHGVMTETPPERTSSAPTAAASQDWRPESPGVRNPAPGQSKTSTLTPDITRDIKAARDAIQWPLERFAELCVALAVQREHGGESTDDLAQRLGLPGEQAMHNTIRLWQDLFDKDADLARQHAALVVKLRQG